MLSADTSLETIYAYHTFFKDANNMPQVQAASPMTDYLWQNMSVV